MTDSATRVYRQPEDPLAAMREIGVVPVVVLRDAGIAAAIGQALADGGLRVVEVTLRTPSALRSLRRVAALPHVVAGAGTVLTAEQVDEAVDAGARFVVSPGLSDDVIGRCALRRVTAIPGVATASELQRAYAMGIHTVKFFPAATSGGPSAIRALSKPFPMMRFIPTGGIRQDTAADYLALSAVEAVGGSWMLPADRLAARDFAGIRQLAREAAAYAQKSRPKDFRVSE